MRRLMTYTTFFVTRHPLEQLVSAQVNKFTGFGREFTAIVKEIALQYIKPTFTFHNYILTNTGTAPG